MAGTAHLSISVTRETESSMQPVSDWPLHSSSSGGGAAGQAQEPAQGVQAQACNINLALSTARSATQLAPGTAGVLCVSHSGITRRALWGQLSGSNLLGRRKKGPTRRVYCSCPV